MKKALIAMSGGVVSSLAVYTTHRTVFYDGDIVLGGGTVIKT